MTPGMFAMASTSRPLCASQAKANETKYTGVSSEDVRSGGFALKSSSGAGSGFGSAGGPSRYSSGVGLGGARSSGAGGLASSSGRSLYGDYDEPSSVAADKVCCCAGTLPVPPPRSLSCRARTFKRASCHAQACRKG